MSAHLKLVMALIKADRDRGVSPSESLRMTRLILKRQSDADEKASSTDEGFSEFSLAGADASINAISIK